MITCNMRKQTEWGSVVFSSVIVDKNISVTAACTCTVNTSNTSNTSNAKLSTFKIGFHGFHLFYVGKHFLLRNTSMSKQQRIE